ncbi:unnamed protein product [Polarella glacialis]|uniref:Uncharacterized protein n=1 Tax=Polarella glacialis TaxID=89957 RepID=A0A813GGL8_POLGL|nr:unnamed protein product [Polarella glacialis]
MGVHACAPPQGDRPAATLLSTRISAARARALEAKLPSVDTSVGAVKKEGTIRDRARSLEAKLVLPRLSHPHSFSARHPSGSEGAGLASEKPEPASPSTSSIKQQAVDTTSALSVTQDRLTPLPQGRASQNLLLEDTPPPVARQAGKEWPVAELYSQCWLMQPVLVKAGAASSVQTPTVIDDTSTADGKSCADAGTDACKAAVPAVQLVSEAMVQSFDEASAEATTKSIDAFAEACADAGTDACKEAVTTVQLVTEATVQSYHEATAEATSKSTDAFAEACADAGADACKQAATDVQLGSEATTESFEAMCKSWDDAFAEACADAGVDACKEAATAVQLGSEATLQSFDEATADWTSESADAFSEASSDASTHACKGSFYQAKAGAASPSAMGSLTETASKASSASWCSSYVPSCLQGLKHASPQDRKKDRKALRMVLIE